MSSRGKLSALVAQYESLEKDKSPVTKGRSTTTSEANSTGSSYSRSSSRRLGADLQTSASSSAGGRKSELSSPMSHQSSARSRMPTESLRERMSKFDKTEQPGKASATRQLSGAKSPQILLAMGRFEQSKPETSTKNVSTKCGDSQISPVDPPSLVSDALTSVPGKSGIADVPEIASQGDSTHAARTSLSRSQRDDIPKRTACHTTPRDSSTSPTLKRKSSASANSSRTPGMSSRKDASASPSSASGVSKRKDFSATTSSASGLSKRKDSSAATSSASSVARRKDSSAATSSPSGVAKRKDSPAASSPSARHVRRKSSDAESSGKKSSPGANGVSRKDSSGSSSPSSRIRQQRRASDVSSTSDSPLIGKKSAAASTSAIGGSKVTRKASTGKSTLTRRKSSLDSTGSVDATSDCKKTTPPSSQPSSLVQATDDSSATPSKRRRSSSGGSPSSVRRTRSCSRSESQSPSTVRSRSSSTQSQKSVDETNGSDWAFDDLDIKPRLVSEHHSHRILVAPTGRRKATQNPIRALQGRDDVLDEVEPAPAESVGKQVFSKSAQLAGMNISIAASALAGLAAKENVSAVKLTSVTDVSATVWPKQLLICIKGRRSLQTRVVEPKASSVCSGDSFILIDGVTRSLFQFIGKGANVVERAKSADLAHDIVYGKDCGCKAAKATIVEEGKISSHTSEGQFWAALNCKDGKPSDCLDENGDDLVVEKQLIKQIVAYEVKDDKVVLREDISGKSLKFAMLDPSKVMIFDFMNEVASWTGRKAPNSIRKNTASLAKEVYDRGYIPVGGKKSQGNRPSWSVLMSCKDGSESVLFRSKFSDWPDPGKLIQTRAPGGKSSSGAGSRSGASKTNKMQSCDIKAMRGKTQPYPGLVVLQRNLGRGHGHAPSDDPCLPGLIVKTVSVKKWLVKDNTCHEIPEAGYPDFFEEDAYIVRWVYSLFSERSNIRTGVQSKQVGSDQSVYFFWQGNKCTVSEKGTAALIVVELSGSEGDPQVRVAQGSEPPAFLQMFSGAMSIHCGSSRSDGSSTKSDVRLYAAHGLVEEEYHLEELPGPITHTSLRSRCSSVLVDTEKSQVYVWHGTSSSKSLKARVVEAAKTFSSRQSSSNPYAVCSASSEVIEVDEGDHCARLQTLVDGLGATSKFWDSGLAISNSSAPLAFLFSVSSGSFNHSALQPQWRKESMPIAFPAPQAAFYHVDQPAIGLVEAGSDLFVWCGWMREVTEDDRSIGSLKSIWLDTKKLAFATAKAYLADMKKDGVPNCRATIVTAGHEPESFRSLFHHWQDSEEAKTAVDKIQPCSQLEPIDLEKELENMAGLTYSLAVLRAKPLPDDVDPKALEQYLTDADFQVAFKKTRDEFNQLPGWKQVQMRKTAGLF